MKKAELERLVEYYESEFENIRRLCNSAEKHRGDIDAFASLLGLVGGICDKEHLKKYSEFALSHSDYPLYLVKDPDKYFEW